MSDNQEIETTIDINVNNVVEIDQLKSDELREDSNNDDACDVVSKEESEKSFKSCPSNNNENSISNDVKHASGEAEETLDDNNDEEDDDDIRPGSCRENPSSDDEVSSWDENNDHWFYDAEYIQESTSGKELPKAEVDKESLQLCEKDLTYIIENHVSKENVNKKHPERKKKKERDSKEINNPTFIPTNGQFYMHDLRSEAKENQSTKSTKNAKNVQKKSNDVWSHDLYDEAKQQPISKDELVNKYGEDIRSKKTVQELKENKQKKSLRQNNFKRQPNYRYAQQSYYDYEYYDNYDNYEGYDPYYYDNYYYDYNYYNSWKKSHKNAFFKNESRNYKSNPALENKAKKPQRPPSKYSKIAEYTDIKITINLDNSGTRQIQSLSNKKNFTTRTYDNVRRGEENLLKNQPESQANNSTQKGQEDSQRDNLVDNGVPDPNRGHGDPNRYHGDSNRGHGDPNRRNSPLKEPQRRYSSQKNPIDKVQGGETQRFNRHKPMPDWLNTKFEWSPHSDFKDVIEEMPPLTEKEINQLQKRPLNPHNPPPRFSRDKPQQQQQQQNDPKMNPHNRPAQSSFVPKRYSELRTQSEVPKASADPPNRPAGPDQLINYPMLSNIDFYNNLQPLLLNINQGPPHSAPANSPQQQTSNNYSSIHPQMVSLSSLIQSGYPADNQFYIQPQLFLPPPNGRLNQFSQPFQPSFVSQSHTAAAASVYPTSQLPASPPNNSAAAANSAASQTIRPVLGRS